MISTEELAQHNTKDDCWIAINGFVFDVTKFMALHPGGAKILLDYGGQDATQIFYDLHKESVFEKYLPRLCIGRLEGDDEVETPGLISQVPYSEDILHRPSWHSPYMNESHALFRERIREWYMNEMEPMGKSLAQSGKLPSKKQIKMMGNVNFFRCLLGPGEHMKGQILFGMKGEDFDHFHEQIVIEERARMSEPSFVDAAGTGCIIGLPPVAHHASPEVREEILSGVFAGDKSICLAVSEPFVGSDVANVHTTAKITHDGEYYIVNGIKKWITGGMFADYFVTAVRTGGRGTKGISMLAIPRTEGVTTKPVKTLYGSTAGTALVIFEDAKVPAKYLLGRENEGFPIIMANFNHERWFAAVSVVGATRRLVEEVFTWTMNRRAFGKKLIDQAVVRFKLADMIAKVEALSSWTSLITYQMTKMTGFEQFIHLGSSMSILKYWMSRVAYELNDHSVELFGGRGLTKTGLGSRIATFSNQVKYGAILGGSESVMADLGVRLAQRAFPANAHL